MNDWKIFTGQGPREDDPNPISRLPAPPPWRDFTDPNRNARRGQVFKPNKETIELVNAAMYLRRPLLVTGKPGTGKSSLARAVAEELHLKLYEWPINTRTILQDGLYRYDALARLRDAQFKPDMKNELHDIGQYITLGPLGLALLPSDRPSILLIDEIDKGDIDLPNDLLHVFEEGEFYIPEITRILSNENKITPQLATVHHPDGSTIIIPDGKIRCTQFPIVIMTSNGERDFSPAFLRRCLRLDINPPREVHELEEIVRAHLGDEAFQRADTLITTYIKDFLRQRENLKGEDHIATDQLLNVVFLMVQEYQPDDVSRDQLHKKLLRALGSN
jgi:MoxR-like ATPase